MGLDFSQILIVGSDHTEAQPEKAETIANASSQASLSDIRKPEPFIVRAFQRMRGGACPLQDPQRYSSSEALLFHVNFCDPEVRRSCEMALSTIAKRLGVSEDLLCGSNAYFNTWQ